MLSQTMTLAGCQFIWKLFNYCINKLCYLQIVAICFAFLFPIFVLYRQVMKTVYGASFQAFIFNHCLCLWIHPLCKMCPERRWIWMRLTHVPIFSHNFCKRQLSVLVTVGKLYHSNFERGLKRWYNSFSNYSSIILYDVVMKWAAKR